VLLIAAGLVTVQLVFRAWALLGGWFYTDDYRLLYDATKAQPSLEYLFRPFDSQLMPIGRLLVDVVAMVGPLSWGAAAALTLLLQGVASVACVWMLVALFGRRWGILPPLCVYLFSVITVPAMMWWAASLNQVPLQAVTFAAVTLWVRYLRRPSPAALLLVGAVLVVGLLAYVKTLLLLPLLLAIQVLYFTSGTWRSRLTGLLGKRALGALVVLALVGLAYVGYYLVFVPPVFTETSWSVTRGLAWTMLGVAFVTAAVGGPWQWSTPNPPTSMADPPGWAVLSAWLACALVVCASLLLRRRAGRAWLLLAGYLVGVWLLTATSRAPLVGADIGLEYRYLTDTAAVLCLALALAFLDLPGASGSSAGQEHPVLVGGVSSAVWVAVAATVTVAVALGGLVSASRHVTTWQTRNPGSDYLHRAMADLTATGRRVPLADQVVPQDVVPGYSHPYNTTGRLLTLVPQPVSFPEAAPQLFVLDERGAVLPAWVDAAAESRPGPVPGCGWSMEAPGGTVPLGTDIVEFPMWMRIAYLASGPSRVTVTAGEESVESTVRPGAQSLFVHHTGGFDEVTLTGLAPGVRVCVDRIEVGSLVPGLGPGAVS
jgi:hypothetical protein